MSREVGKGVSYIAISSTDLILRYAGDPTYEEDNIKDLWSDALNCVGGTYTGLAVKNTGKGDMRMMPWE